MDLADAIDQKLRIGKVDALLLYVASFQTVILTLSQVFLGGWTLVYYPAIFIFVAVMPIYVGYVRGAITRNSLVERTRGWLYLIFGTVYYLAVVSVWVLGRVSTIIRVAQMAVFLLLGWLLARTVPVSGDKILKALGGSADESTLESFERTGEAILYLSLTLAAITGNPDMMSDPLGAGGLILFIALNAWAVWNAEKWARLSEKGYVQEKQRTRNGRLRWLGILGLGLWVLAWPILTIFGAADMRWRTAGIGMILTGCFLLLISLLLSRRLPVWKVRIRRVKIEGRMENTGGRS